MRFSQEQLRTLIALIDRIIPADEFPSASQNGVAEYINRLLRSDLQHRADQVQAGLSSLDEKALARYGRAFAELDEAAQDELLRLIEADAFFGLMVTLTHEGYFTDPSNGSNLDTVSWRMIGYEPRVPEKHVKEKWLEGLA